MPRTTTSHAASAAKPPRELPVVEDGSPDAPVMLLLSNAAAPPAIWDPVVPSLAERHRVIRVDLLSATAPSSSNTAYYIDTLARRVGALLDRLGVTRATVTGHSSGCTVATALAEQRPKMVAALVLIDMGPDVAAKIPEGRLVRLLLRPLLGRFLWRLRSESSVRKAARAGFTRPVDVPDVLVEHAMRLRLQDFRAAMRAPLDYLAQQSLPDRLAPLGIPLLVIFGAEDRRWRPSSTAAYAVVPGARVELLPGVGHTPMMEDPQATAQLLLQFAADPARPSSRRRHPSVRRSGGSS